LQCGQGRPPLYPMPPLEHMAAINLNLSAAIIFVVLQFLYICSFAIFIYFCNFYILIFLQFLYIFAIFLQFLYIYIFAFLYTQYLNR
jgi:hypothetical protein